MSHAPGFLKAVTEAKKHIQETNIEVVKARLDRGDTFHFVDVREDDEWKAGRARGAIHIGKGVIERDIEAKIPDKNAEIVLYCGGGFRSALAAVALQDMGYTRVVSMDGGMRAWREQNYPVQND